VLPRLRTLLYTRRAWVLWEDGTPGRGGCDARIPGFGEQGEGRTIDQALTRLASALRRHVEHWDAEAEDHDCGCMRPVRDTLNEEPALIIWTREHLRDDTVSSALRLCATDTQLAPADEQEISSVIDSAGHGT
jgi:hypothetical protein